MSKLQEKNIVSQANSLVEARYRVTKVEQKLLFSMISLIDPNDKEFLTFSVDAYHLAEILNLDKKSYLRELETVVTRLMTRVIKINMPTGWEMYHWLSNAKLKNNVISLRFHDDLKPCLLELKKTGNFTQSKLGLSIGFNSVYAIRIYQLLKEYYSKNMYEFEFTLQDFRKLILGENSKKHIRLFHFRNKVIHVAQKELGKINKELSTKEVVVYKSDLNFTYTTRRTGRKISHLKFIIYKQNTTAPVAVLPKNNADDENKNIAAIILEYEKYGVTRATTLPYLEERGEESLTHTLNRFKADQKAGKVKDNMGGYLATLLRKNAGQKSQGEIEEEKRQAEAKRKAEEAKKQKMIQEKREDFENEFSKSARKEFLDNLSEAEQEKIRQDYIQTADSLYAGILRKQNLYAPIYIAAYIHLIPNLKERQKEYADQKLKALGLMD